MLNRTIKFSDNGTKVAIISGTHGNESNAVKIVSLLYRALASKDQQPIEGIGSIEFILGLNDTGLIMNSREYVNFQKSTDLNRSFETEPASFIFLQSQVKATVERNDVIVDVHNSPKCMNSFCVDYAYDAPFFVEFLTRCSIPFTLRPTSNSTIKKFANDSGKIGFTLELDNMGYSSDKTQISTAIDFLKKFLEAVKTMHVPKAYDADQATIWTGGSYGSSKEVSFLDLHKYLAYDIISHSNGLIEYAKETPLTSYQKGELIANVVAYDGTLLEQLKAPDNGFMTCISESWHISENESLGELQPLFS